MDSLSKAYRYTETETETGDLRPETGNPKPETRDTEDLFSNVAALEARKGLWRKGAKRHRQRQVLSRRDLTAIAVRLTIWLALAVVLALFFNLAGGAR